MKKKVYMAPATAITRLQLQPLLKAVSNIKGDTGIEFGPADDIPSDADARHHHSQWDDDDDDDQW